MEAHAAWVLSQALLAGAAFQLAAVHLVQAGDQIRTGNRWLAAWAAAVGGALLANTLTPMVADAAVRALLTVRTAFVTTTIMLIVVVVGRMTGRRVPRLVFWPLLAVGVARVLLTMLTDTVFVGRVDAGGWPVYGLGHLLTATPTFPLVIGFLVATYRDWDDPFERRSLIVSLVGTIGLGLVATFGEPGVRELATGTLGVPLLAGLAATETHRARIVARRRERVERERHELSLSLQTANDALNAALAVRDDLLDAVSHELRTPLTPIRGYVELLRERLESMDTPTIVTYLDVVDRNADRLQNLVDEVLTARSLRPGIPAAGGHELVPLRDVLEDAVEGVGPGLVSIDCPGRLAATANRDHLGHVVRRLVENAQAHGAPPIDVSARWRGDRVEIRVRDHGAGVPEDFRARLFEPFTQASVGSRRRSGGVGLGLSTARLFAEAMGGSLSLEDHGGEGACFLLVVPAPVGLAQQLSSLPDVSPSG